MASSRSMFPSLPADVTRSAHVAELRTPVADTSVHETLVALLPRVRAWLRRDFGPDHDIDDAMQDALAAVARALPSFRGDSALTTFAYRITMRVAATHHRRRRRRELFVRAPEPTHASTGDPEARLISRGALRRIYRALERLPQKRRQAFVLCCIEGMSATAAADLVGVKPATMRSRLRHARKDIARRLSHDDTLRELLGGPK